MNQVRIPNRFLITILVFVIFVIGVFLATKLEQFREINFGAINIGLLLANSVVLLIILSLLLESRQKGNSTKKKGREQ